MLYKFIVTFKHHSHSIYTNVETYYYKSNNGHLTAKEIMEVLKASDQLKHKVIVGVKSYIGFDTSLERKE